VITMDIEIVTTMLSMIDKMENITEVELTFGEISVKVKKESSSYTKQPEESQMPEFAEGEYGKATLEADQLPFFATAKEFSPAADTNGLRMASAAQVKYATDLVNKLKATEMQIVNGLAHKLGATVDDILPPSNWKEEMTTDHADQYIDILEEQWNKNKKKGAWN
jgi:hypothetical protein